MDPTTISPDDGAEALNAPALKISSVNAVDHTDYEC